MRFPTPAQLRALNAFPDDIDIGGETYPGRVFPGQFPKGTTYRTINNLFNAGFVTQAWCMPVDVPLRLTDKGKEALK